MDILLSYPDFKEEFENFFQQKISIDPNSARTFDLMIIPGGEDIDPRRYGKPSVGSIFNSSRDDVEIPLVTQVINDRVARNIFGVCRGMQLLHVLFGGSLIQDLPSSGKGHSMTHSIEWSETTMFSDIITVNSFHHQALSGRSGLKVLAREPYTGIAEAATVENAGHVTNFFMTQFHPEFFGDELAKDFAQRIVRWVNGDSIITKIAESDASTVKDKKWGVGSSYWNTSSSLPGMIRFEVQ